MADNWVELMELVKYRNEAILNEMQKMRIYQNGKANSEKHGFVANFVLGGLGKAFSSIGESLQEHYHFEPVHHRNPMKKVS